MYETNKIEQYDDPSTMRLITLIIFAFSFYLFLAGHNNPGGGFIGGLMTASAILLLYIAFDMKKIKKEIPINFTSLIGIGLLTAVGTGIATMLFDYPFLTHFFDYFQFPIIGEIELTTALCYLISVSILLWLELL